MEAADDPQAYAELQHEALVGEISDPVYTRSNGVRVRLADVATPHLRIAHAKLAREWPDHPEIAPMADEIAKRDAAYAAQQAEVQS